MGRRKKIKVENSNGQSNLNDDAKIDLAIETEQNEKTESSNDSDVEEFAEFRTEQNSETPPNYEQDLADIDKLIVEETSEKKRGRKSKEEKARVAITIPGSLFVRVHNMLAANGIALLDSYVSKKNPIPAELLSMEEKVIQELAPVAELAMKEMKIEENPIAAFYIMFGASMAGNYMALKAQIKNAMKVDPTFDINNIEKK